MTLQSYKEKKISQLREKFRVEPDFSRHYLAEYDFVSFISDLIDEIEKAIPDFDNIKTLKSAPIEERWFNNGVKSILQEIQDNINKL